jgi:hypothetical protein
MYVHPTLLHRNHLLNNFFCSLRMQLLPLLVKAPANRRLRRLRLRLLLLPWIVTSIVYVHPTLLHRNHMLI